MNSPDTKCSAGFTLVELLVTMGISFVLGSAGFLFLRSQLRSLTDQAGGLDAIEGARAALDFMAYEIRQAGSPTGACSAATPLSNANSTQLTIAYCDATGTLQTVIYAYSSSAKAITRTVAGTPSTLISNVPSGGLSFAYYQADGGATDPALATPVATPANVKTVKVTVQVTTARATTATTVSIGSRIALRNRVLTNLSKT